MGRDFPRTLLRIEGFADSVAYRIERLQALLAEFGATHVLHGEDSRRLWRSIRDARIPRRAARARGLARQPRTLRRARRFVARSARRAAPRSSIGAAASSGSRPSRPKRRRQRCARRRARLAGHATLMRAPTTRLRARVDVFEPPCRSLLEQTSRLKASLDPPGRVQSRPHVRGRLTMQTHFAPEHLADPKLPVAGEDPALLRALRLLHRDLPDLCGRRRRARQSARPHLSHQGSVGDRPRADAEDVAPIDHCLSCYSCMTTCPSGVDYRRLVDHAREMIETDYDARPGRQVAARDAAWVLPSPTRFRFAIFLAMLGRPFASARGEPAERRQATGRDARLAPRRLKPHVHEGPGETRAPVAPRAPPCRAADRLRAGACWRRRSTQPTIRVLNRIGVDVVLPKGEGCCGSLLHHMGREAARSRQHARQCRRLDARDRRRGPRGDRRHRLGLRRDHQGLRPSARATIPPMPRRPRRLRARQGPEPNSSPRSTSTFAGRTKLVVAYHAACSLQHGQKITEAPKPLLQPRGLRGAHARRIASLLRLGRHLQHSAAGHRRRTRGRKVANIARLKPDVIAAGNIGCLTQIGAGSGDSRGAYGRVAGLGAGRAETGGAWAIVGPLPAALFPAAVLWSKKP